MKQGKRNTIKFFFKLQKWRNQIKSKKLKINKTYNNEEKPYLKKNEVYLLSPNFKLASK